MAVQLWMMAVTPQLKEVRPRMIRGVPAPSVSRWQRGPSAPPAAGAFRTPATPTYRPAWKRHSPPLAGPTARIPTGWSGSSGCMVCAGPLRRASCANRIFASLVCPVDFEAWDSSGASLVSSQVRSCATSTVAVAPHHFTFDVWVEAPFTAAGLAPPPPRAPPGASTCEPYHTAP